METSTKVLLLVGLGGLYYMYTKKPATSEQQAAAVRGAQIARGVTDAAGRPMTIAQVRKALPQSQAGLTQDQVRAQEAAAGIHIQYVSGG